MRKPLWIAPLLFAAIAIPKARAFDVYTDYTAIFCATACEETPPPAQTVLSSDITYDDTTNTFTVFQVEFEGTNYDLTASANDPVLVGGGLQYYGCTQDATPPTPGGLQTLYLMVECLGEGYGAADVTLTGGVLTLEGGEGSPTNAIYVSSDPTTFSESSPVVGSMFIAATPEPSSLALLLAGLAGIGFWSRKRVRGQRP